MGYVVWRAAASFLAIVIGAQAQAADRLSFQLGWLPGGERAPFYLAAQTGLFAEENLDVTIAAGRGSEDVLSKLSVGTYELGEAGFDALLNRYASGQTSVMAVMPIYSKQPDCLVTTISSGIANLKDVKGKTIGTSPFTSSNVMWPIILAENGLAPADVKLLKVDGSALAAMLATGQIDAMINWLPGAALAAHTLKTAGQEVRVLPWTEYGFEGYSQAVVASRKVLQEKPDAVRRFVKAMRKAIKLTAERPTAAAEAVKMVVPEVDMAVVRAQLAAAVPLMVNDVTERDGIGIFNPILVSKTWTWVARAGNVPIDRIDPLTTISSIVRPN